MFDHCQSLPELLSLRAGTDPDALYIQDAEAGAALTYGEADILARGWAHGLARAGVQRGRTVLTMLPPGFPAIGSWLGIAWLGALEVPVNVSYRGRMLRYIVEDSLSNLLIVHADYLQTVIDAIGEDVALDTIVVVGGPPCQVGGITVVGEADFLADADPVKLAAPAAHDIASILYTSGTTGPSKGVLVPWTQARLTGTGITPPELFDETDGFYSPFPMYHMSGKGPLFAMALVGGRVIIRSRFSTDAFWSDVRTFGVSTTILMGAMVNFLVGQPESSSDADSPLRDAIMLPLADNLEGFERRFGLRARTTFNMTETACCILSEGYNLANVKSCGRVRPGFEARVVDSNDNEVEPGVLGELVLRSEKPWALMAGYWNKPEATANAWRNQWLHTGDGFTCDADGNYYFADRLKDAIRRRGENVSSAEVEADVNEHPAVLESAAIAVPSEQSEDEIKIVVVRKPGAVLTAVDLVTFLEGRMARFMVPRYIEFVDELPKTPTLKIRKAELRAHGVTPETHDRGDSRRNSVRENSINV
ncbi:ATP-dependent acyl-CoA ligase [Rhodococcus sp. ACPA4]|uniref:AMP-binding protein n=1 Tax=Rhodococcus sp. ACPA4 TaxID=2028571 RepID=UPI000BB14FC7|nr:AMP-binding protein [Rhodococcus sp. ACPA4]PBC36025.1 ATP-dependent acyl-CoA ligase [Rhodococcus sp. ACPA4]